MSKCTHMIGTVGVHYEGIYAAEDHPKQRANWGGDYIEEKFEYCPRCGVKIEHFKNGKYAFEPRAFPRKDF